VIHVHAGHAIVHPRHILILAWAFVGFMLLILVRCLERNEVRSGDANRERNYRNESDRKKLSSVHGLALLIPILRTKPWKISRRSRSVPHMQERVASASRLFADHGNYRAPSVVLAAGILSISAWISYVFITEWLRWGGGVKRGCTKHEE
jgi:hypothetical protein